MRVALVLTVKNEERLLRHNLLYHRALGAEHIFVYFDGTTDGGKAAISDLDFVTLQDSVSPEKYEHLTYLEKFTSQADEHHTARQCLNTFDAQQECKAMGINWLVSLDADELVCPNTTEIIGLPQFFDTIPPQVEIVYLQTREFLQHKISIHNVFSEGTLFKTTPTYRSRLKNITKQLDNPFTGQQQKFPYWYGQTMGKGAIRIGKDVIPHNVHRYKKVDGLQVTSVKAGLVLHYHAYDAADFIKKFTNFSEHPDTFLSGNSVESIKLLLRDVVNKSGKTETELKTYFENNLMFSRTEVTALLKNKYLWLLSRDPAPLEEITSVQQVFQQKIKAH